MPAREAFGQTVPVSDLLLADLPAEQDLLALVHRREVHQTPIEILHLATQLVNALHAVRNSRRFGLHLGLGLGERVRAYASAVAAHQLFQPLPALESSGETVSMLHHPLRERPYGRK